jgi:hypothetical protein
MRRANALWIALGTAAVATVGLILYNTWGAKRANPTGTGRRGAEWSDPPAPARRSPGGRRILGDIEVDGPSLTLRDEQGREVWSARSAGRLAVDDASRKAVATDVTWTLRRERDRLTVESDRMELAWGGGDVAFVGDVAIMAPPNRHFTAPRARYEAATRKLFCEGGVEWQAGRYAGRAGAMVVDVTHRRIRLRDGVRLRVRA